MTYKNMREFLHFVLKVNDMRVLAQYFEKEIFKVGEICSDNQYHKFYLWCIASNALMLKEENLLCEELQNV